MNKTDEACEKIRKLLASGKYGKDTRFPSEYRLADWFGMNRATVSKAMNVLVSEGLLERAGKSRQGTIVKNTGVFSKGNLLFLATNLYIYESEVMRGMLSSAFDLGYMTWVLNPHIDNLETTVRQLESLDFKGVCTNIRPHSFSVPCVYFGISDFLPDDRYEWSVSADVHSGGRMIADYLLEKGHTDFIYYSGCIRNLGTMSRKDGFFSRMREAKVESSNKRLLYGFGNDSHSIRELLRFAHKRFPKLNAVVCGNDFDALECISVMKTLHFDMENIIVTGFGNILHQQRFYKFPTVEEHHFNIGVRAGVKLVELIENGPGGQEHVEILPVEFIP